MLGERVSAPDSCHVLQGGRSCPEIAWHLADEQLAEQESSQQMTLHEANRVKKAVESNLRAIENRIRFFQREEEKIWRDLDEVRRQAATVEEGRARAREKKLTSRSIAHARDLNTQQNRMKAATQRQANLALRTSQLVSLREKQQAVQQQRQLSKDLIKQKRLNENQVRLANAERAVAVQRAKLEASFRVNQEKALRIQRLRAEHEAERDAARQDVLAAEARLPELEAEELLCLQRLQNSRMVTQSVLEELESSLGSRPAMASIVVRAKDDTCLEPA